MEMSSVKTFFNVALNLFDKYRIEELYHGAT